MNKELIHMFIKDFEILRYLCETHGALTQRLIAEEIGTIDNYLL